MKCNHRNRSSNNYKNNIHKNIDLCEPIPYPRVVKKNLVLTVKNTTGKILTKKEIANVVKIYVKDNINSKTKDLKNLSKEKDLNHNICQSNMDLPLAESVNLFENVLINDYLEFPQLPIDELFSEEQEIPIDWNSQSNGTTLSTIPVTESGIETLDLSDLPWEDFLEIDSFIENMDDNIYTQSHGCNTGNNQVVKENFNEYSDQDSPLQLDAEYKDLLDTIDDADFLKNVSFEKTSVINDMNSLIQEVEPTSITSVIDEGDADERLTDILALLNEQFGVEPDSVKCNPLKRKSSASDPFTSKCQKVDDEHDHIVPSSPALSLSSNSSNVSTSSADEHRRRIKNNEASRKTRAKRKQRQTGLFEKKNELEKSNAELRIKIELMQKEAEILREALVAKLSK